MLTDWVEQRFQWHTEDGVELWVIARAEIFHDDFGILTSRNLNIDLDQGYHCDDFDVSESDWAQLEQDAVDKLVDLVRLGH